MRRRLCDAKIRSVTYQPPEGTPPNLNKPAVPPVAPPPWNPPPPPPAQPGAYPPPPPGVQGGPPYPPPPVQPGAYPPPPPGAAAAVKVPPLAWVIVIGGVIGFIGLFTPWFRPEIKVQGETFHGDSLFAWEDGRVGLIGPIFLGLIALGAFLALIGKQRRAVRFGKDEVESVGIAAMIAGAVAIVALLIAWFMVTSQYKVPTDFKNWDDMVKQVEAAGGSVSRGPGIGFWLTGIGGVVSLVGGALTFFAHKSTSGASKKA